MELSQIKSVHSLFSQVTEAEWQEAVLPNDTASLAFVPEEVLQPFQPDAARLGILLSGTAAAFTHDAKIVRKFRAPHLFGLSALFADSPSYPTEIVASSSGQVFWLKGSAVKKLLGQSPGFLTQYLKITSEKLIFLNDHIDLLLYESARDRMEAFLVRRWQRFGNPCPILYNRKEWAQYLGISRASLYRELDHMQQEGWILVEKKQITLTEFYLKKRSLL